MSIFETLNSVNVNDHVEKKNGLSYLTWAWAWAEVKKRYPRAEYTVYENKDGMNYHTDGRTAWVKTGVRIEGLEHIEYLPVMDHRNNSIPLDKVTSFDVNKAIQRSLTKAAARHGLGLYIYAGEDLPETPGNPKPAAASAPRTANDKGKNENAAESEITQKNGMAERLGRLKRWKAETGMDDAFITSKKTEAVTAGLIPDKKVKDMTAEEFDEMMSYLNGCVALPWEVGR